MTSNNNVHNPSSPELLRTRAAANPEETIKHDQNPTSSSNDDENKSNNDKVIDELKPEPEGEEVVTQTVSPELSHMLYFEDNDCFFGVRKNA